MYPVTKSPIFICSCHLSHRSLVILVTIPTKSVWKSNLDYDKIFLGCLRNTNFKYETITEFYLLGVLKEIFLLTQVVERSSILSSISGSGSRQYKKLLNSEFSNELPANSLQFSLKNIKAILITIAIVINTNNDKVNSLNRCCSTNYRSIASKYLIVQE
jgi:hypothetical protein